MTTFARIHAHNIHIFLADCSNVSSQCCVCVSILPVLARFVDDREEKTGFGRLVLTVQALFNEIRLCIA